MVGATDITRMNVTRPKPLGSSYLKKVEVHAATRLPESNGEVSPAEVALSLKRFLKIEDHRLRMAHLLGAHGCQTAGARRDRKSTRLNFSHVSISYAVFCLKKKTSRL